MGYKQHKENLRGQIKNKVERKLYNKRIRANAIDVDTNERQLTIPIVARSTLIKKFNDGLHECGWEIHNGIGTNHWKGGGSWNKCIDEVVKYLQSKGIKVS